MDSWMVLTVETRWWSDTHAGHWPVRLVSRESFVRFTRAAAHAEIGHDGVDVARDQFIIGAIRVAHSRFIQSGDFLRP